jgi:hypothetical protein
MKTPEGCPVPSSLSGSGRPPVSPVLNDCFRPAAGLSAQGQPFCEMSWSTIWRLRREEQTVAGIGRLCVSLELDARNSRFLMLGGSHVTCSSKHVTTELYAPSQPV